MEIDDKATPEEKLNIKENKKRVLERMEEHKSIQLDSYKATPEEQLLLEERFRLKLQVMTKPEHKKYFIRHKNYRDCTDPNIKYDMNGAIIPPPDIRDEKIKKLEEQLTNLPEGKQLKKLEEQERKIDMLTEHLIQITNQLNELTKKKLK